MKRLALLSWFALLASFALAQGQGINLEVQGDVKVVKVDRIIVVKDDLTVVNSFPFTIQAGAGSTLYFWAFPSGVVATDKGDHLEVISAPKGPLTISVKAIAVDFESKRIVTKIGQISFSIGVIPPGPVPPTPDPPTPPVPPVPPPNPAPITEPGFRVLFIFEQAEITAEQNNIMAAAALRSYLDEKCAKDGSAPARRFYDKDIPTAADFPWVQKAMQRTRGTLPWLIISNGVTGHEGPMPGTLAETMALLKKFGG